MLEILKFLLHKPYRLMCYQLPKKKKNSNIHLSLVCDPMHMHEVHLQISITKCEVYI